MSLFAMLIFVSGGALKSCAAKEDFVAVDLRYGIVTGYSPYISFVRTPTAPASSRSDVRAGQSCSSQAVLRVTMSDPNKGMTLMLDYGHSPRLWTLDISDSLIHDDSNFSTTDQAAEAHIHNRQLRVYASGFHGYPDAAVGGRHLVHVTDDVVKKGSRLQLDVSTERLEVATPRGAVLHEMESPFLFNVSAQRALQTGSWEYELFVGLNRVVSSAHRSGSGLCKVEISLYEFDDPPGAELSDVVPDDQWLGSKVISR